MVRVPGSSGGSQEFHCESDEDVTKIKWVSAEGVSPQTLLSAGRNSDNAKEKGRDMDLKTSHSSPGSFGSPCGFRDLVDETRTVRAERPSITHTPPNICVVSNKKKPKSGEKKLKAPGSDAEDRYERTWIEEELAQMFHKKHLFAFLLEIQC
ncbi:hypothetical protein PHMEG_00023333 [Phytophthora megakarya]|uniref:Uncharacterized protein n=1 Tax=Phytophthora megakarya TaxID=4795 RepID=A0A225VIE1_9STRA|nr:hypothetical protein PHMEG_00023333 [Phytophthora megakarya]